jgi:hypothetical protein
LLLSQSNQAELPAPCRACHIHELASHALLAGATIYIMTSAMDIAHDLLLPALRSNQRRLVVLSVCPFSVSPITLALTMCGLRGLVLAYNSGNCRDYAAWARADVGIKPEQTFLLLSTHNRLLALLDAVALARSAKGQTAAARFSEVQNLYMPAGRS